MPFGRLRCEVDLAASCSSYIHLSISSLDDKTRVYFLNVEVATDDWAFVGLPLEIYVHEFPVNHSSLYRSF